jgi:hypothetical protein
VWRVWPILSRASTTSSLLKGWVDVFHEVYFVACGVHVLPPIPEGDRDGLLGNIGEVLVGQVLICLLVRTPYGAFGGDVRSLVPCDAGVTGAPGEDHPLVKGALDIADLHEDS